MRRISDRLVFAASLALGLAAVVTAAPASTDILLPTQPEATGFRKSNHFEDVTAYIRELQSRSDKLRVEILLHTAEGREVPLVVMGDPLPESPAAALADARPVVFLQGNIHAGEVEGKDSLLMLMRDMLFGDKRELLRRNIYLVVPIFNADSNERISPQNRSYMPNPEEGVGLRQNSQNYDLNRDYIKTDSREVRAAIARIILPWDPLVFVDLHTTDGSYHQETVTYLSPRAPNWDEGISGFLWDRLYPALTERLAARGISLLPYGDFVDDFKPELGWSTHPPSPRMGVDYVGFRNRFAVLVENYAYAPYATRVKHCYEFVAELSEYVGAHAAEMKALAREADRRSAGWAALPATERPPLSLSVDSGPQDGTLTIQGFACSEIIDSRGRKRPKPILDQPRTYTVAYHARFTPKTTRPLPAAYLLRTGCETVVAQLLRHGIRVERLTAPARVTADQFKTATLKVNPWVVEGHADLTVTGEWQPQELEAEVGWFLVPMDQPLARLIACLMEPEHPDSLAVWNFWNNWITRQWYRDLPPLPLYRLMEAPRLQTRRAELGDVVY